MKLRLKIHRLYGQVAYVPGDVVDLPDEEASYLLQHDGAEILREAVDPAQQTARKAVRKAAK